MGGLAIEVGTTCALTYGPEFGSEVDFRLMEVDESLLNEVLSGGVCLKGAPDDEAVFCTSTKTFSIKYVGTSNTVLLIPPASGSVHSIDRTTRGLVADGGDFPKLETSPGVNGQDDPANGSADEIGPRKIEALATASGHLEISQIPPKLGKLKGILSECVLRQDDIDRDDGDEIMEDAAPDVCGEEKSAPWRSGSNKKAGYRLGELLEMVQASEKELRDGLRVLQAVEVRGKWRMVDEKCLGRILDMLLLTAVQHDWDLQLLREDVVVGVMKEDGCAPYLVRHCLDVYGEKVHKCASLVGDGKGGGGSKGVQSGTASVDVVGESDCVEARDGEDGRLWCLDGVKLCVHRARQLLAGVAKWRLEDFMEAWEQNAPQGEGMVVKPSLEMLKGEALVESGGGDAWVRQFRAKDLPSAPSERFELLFRERSKWVWEDLEPLLRDLEAPGQSIEALLLKFTRKCQMDANSPPFFTTR